MTLFSQAGSHNYASHTQPLESDLEKKMNATCGRKCLEQFEKFNRPGLWARTFAALLIGMEGWFSMKCKLTWKLSATKSHRFYFQLVPSTLRTEETEFGLLPTPTAMDSNGATANMKSTQVKEGSMHSMTLSRLMLLTPSASDGMRSQMTMNSLKRHNKKNAEKSNLAEQISHKVGGGTSHLSPQFVMEMMGFPVDWTLLPFLNGEQSQSKQEETQ